MSRVGRKRVEEFLFGAYRKWQPADEAIEFAQQYPRCCVLAKLTHQLQPFLLARRDGAAAVIDEPGEHAIRWNRQAVAVGIRHAVTTEAHRVLEAASRIGPDGDRAELRSYRTSDGASPHSGLTGAILPPPQDVRAIHLQGVAGFDVAGKRMGYLIPFDPVITAAGGGADDVGAAVAAMPVPHVLPETCATLEVKFAHDAEMRVAAKHGVLLVN